MKKCIGCERHIPQRRMGEECHYCQVKNIWNKFAIDSELISEQSYGSCNNESDIVKCIYCESVMNEKKLLSHFKKDQNCLEIQQRHTQSKKLEHDRFIREKTMRDSSVKERMIKIIIDVNLGESIESYIERTQKYWELYLAEQEEIKLRHISEEGLMIDTKETVFFNHNFQPEFPRISMMKKNKKWNKNSGSCDDCEFLATSGFWWDIHPTLRVILLCEEHALERGLISETKPKTRSRTITQSVRRKIWKRDNGQCVNCGSELELEYDHIIPFSKGGSNSENNIQLLCRVCNRVKSDSI